MYDNNQKIKLKNIIEKMKLKIIRLYLFIIIIISIILY